MTKKSKHHASHIHAKTYLPPRHKSFPSNHDTYPEFHDATHRNKPNIALCFSGGGTRSAAATVGQLRALHLGLGILEKFRYISCVSGSAWPLVAFYYGALESDEGFLGRIMTPEMLTYQNVMEEESSKSDAKQEGSGEEQKDSASSPQPQKSFIHAICSTNVFQRFMKNVGEFDDRAYAKAVGDMYLEPFGAGDRERFFTWTQEYLNDILRRNPHLSKDDFYHVKRDNLPLLITGTMLFSNTQLDPYHRKFLVEMCPLYIGNQILLPHGETEKEITSRRGGGFVEPHGFNTVIRDDEQLSISEDGLLIVETKELELKDVQPESVGRSAQSIARSTSTDPHFHSDMTVQHVRVKVTHPFTLCDMIGTTSAAPASELHKLRANYRGNGFPSFNYWSPSMCKARGVETERLQIGDGGVIDNLGLISMLRRRVTSVICLLNTNRRLLVEDDSQEKTKSPFLSQISQDLVIYFGKEKYHKCVQQNTTAGVAQRLDARILTTEKIPNLYPIKLMSYISETDFIKNHVLDDEDGKKYETLIQTLITKRKNGEMPYHRDTYNVLDNAHQGVTGGWKVDILWIYNERVKNWEDRIPQQEREQFRFGEKKSPFFRFPNYRSFLENRNNLIGLKFGQANLLSHLSCASVLACSEDIKDMLHNEIGRMEKRRKLPPPPKNIRRRGYSLKSRDAYDDSIFDTELQKKQKKRERLEALSYQLLRHFREVASNLEEHDGSPTTPAGLESGKEFITEYCKARVIEYLYSSFRLQRTVRKMIVEIQYKEETPKKYMFKESRSVLITACCMEIFLRLNAHWTENAVPASIETYDVYSYVTSAGEHFGLIELVNPIQESQSVPQPQKYDFKSLAGHTAAALLLGLQGYTPHSFTFKEGKMYALHLKNSFGLKTSRLDQLKAMLYVPESLMHEGKPAPDKWFSHACKVAYNVLPPIKELVEPIQQHVQDEEMQKKMIEFVTHRYHNYRGQNLIEKVSRSVVVRLSQVAKMLKVKKEDFSSISLAETHCHVVCWNVFRVGFDSLQKLTQSTSGWNVAAACKRDTEAFLVSRKTGALYRFHLIDGSSHLVNRTLKWAETVAIGFYEKNRCLYIARNGKKRHDLCKVNVDHGTITPLTSVEHADSISKGAMLQNSSSMYFIHQDSSVHCMDLESETMREVLPKGSLVGFSDHFIASDNVFFAFGTSGVGIFDPSAACFTRISNQSWNPIAVGPVEPQQMRCFLLVTEKGHLMLWDSRTDHSRIISHWNEDWSDASAIF